MIDSQLIQRVFLLAIILGGSFASSTAHAEPRQWALLIGVDDYVEAADLKYCGADQRALKEHLVSSGFPEEHVFLLEDKAKETRYLPIKSNIEKQLDVVLSLAKKEDMLVLAFSGHGVHIDGKSYLCPTDARLDDPETLISQDDIYQRLKNCRASLKLVLVDACRNDPRPGGQRSFKPTAGSRAFARDLKEVRLPEGLLLLHSCTAGEISWEEEKFGHGVFMHFVLQGLEGEADGDKDGKVTLGELAEYSGDQTQLYVARKYSDSQRPFLRGDLTTEALRFSFGISSGQNIITNSIGMELR